MAQSFVNPLAQVASFRNQQLAPVMNQQSSSVGVTGSTEPDRQASADLSGFDRVSNRATRQHDMFLQAVKAEQARRQPKVPNMDGSGNYRRAQGGAGGGKPGFGQYGLVQGADQALQGLNAAFRKQFGSNLTINRGYRSYEDQARLYALYKAGRGNLAAKPGHSVHQSGRAVDFGGAIQNANSREHRWLQQNAGAFGFKWTGKNFSQFEPWHWEWWG